MKISRHELGSSRPDQFAQNFGANPTAESVFRSGNCKIQHKKFTKNSRRESWEALDRTILHRISMRIQLYQLHFAKTVILKSNC